MEEAICWIASCPADLSRFNGNDIHELKYTIALGGLLLYLIFEFLAGMKKFGFIVINIPLGGTDRGTYSSYMGTTPFFIRLPINHPDSDPSRFKPLIELIRAGVAASRGQQKGMKRALVRFRQAGRAVQAVLILGSIIEDMRDLIRGGKVKTAAAFWTEMFARQPKSPEQPLEVKQQYVSMGSEEEAQTGLRRSMTSVKTSFQKFVRKAKPKLDKDMSTSAKIFSQIDQDGSGTIDYGEFENWLREWCDKVGTSEEMTVDQLCADCNDLFDEFNDDDDDVLSLAEFSRLLNAGGLIDLLRKSGLYNSMICANLFDVQAIQNVFDQFDLDESGAMDVDELETAFHDLHMHPTHDEVRMLLRKFDEDHNGTLSKDEFTKLMLEYMSDNEAQASFTQPSYCPITMFQVALDFIRWGQTTTDLLKNEFESRGYAGLMGYRAFSGAYMYTFETTKTRWLHAEGNPIPLHKINVYLGEALLLYVTILAVSGLHFNPSVCETCL